MQKFYAFLAASAALAPSVLYARGPEHRFTRAGVTYVYTVAPAASGRQIIEGRRLNDGSAFRLVVSGDRVNGISGGQPIAFRTVSAAGTTLAAR